MEPGSWLSKANTFIYEFDFRRVKVAASSLQVFPTRSRNLSAAVRVAGPAFTWIRDTRDSPLDAHRGTYTSFQEFSPTHVSARKRSSTASMFRTPAFTASTRTALCWRATRAMARNAPLDADRIELIPLPERLYAGGPTSLRGFSINAAGPRDPETGFPIGGAGALINSTELRLPPPTLPWLATRSASSSFTIWATSSPMPAMPGPARFAFTSPTATPARS